MVIPLFAQVTGFKIESFWRRGSRGAVRCTARLSRRLRADEAERIERLENTSIARAEVVHECGPDEIEEWQTKLVDALAGAAPGPTRSVAVGERRSRRSQPKPSNAPPPLPDPAA